MKKENIIAIITGPSAVGKTTIAKILLKKLKNFKATITYTTRKKRENHKEDKIINYVSKKKFRKLIDENNFLEWAQVYNNFYGTAKKETLELLKKNNILLNIDVQGALIIKKKYPKCLTIFILPENIETLKKRLGKRKISKIIIKKRLNNSRNEIAQSKKFDYLITNYNDHLSKTVEKIRQILTKY